jgi:hypothetical protein
MLVSLNQTSKKMKKRNKQLCLFSVIIIIMIIAFAISISALDHFYVPLENKKKMISRFKSITVLPLTQHPEIINPKSILIFMVATPEIHEYAQYSIENNRLYAKQFNFEFRVVDTNLVPDLPIEFTKLEAILRFMKLMPKVKYIMHIDADASIKNQSYDLRNIIIPYLQMIPHRHFLVGEDCFKRTVCSKPNHMNSGSFIVKNTIIGQSIIRDWLHSARTTCKQFVNKFPNCQNVFEHCTRRRFWPFIKIVPYNLINGVDGLFIEHLMQQKTQDRMDRFKLHQMQNYQNRRIKVY